MAIEYTPIVVPMNVSVSTESKAMSVSTSEEHVGMNVASIIEVIRDYNRLMNKPSINGVELFGDKTAYDLGLAYRIKYGTKEYWAENLSYIPLEGELIVITNYDTIDGVDIPAIKVGDGLAYAADLPCVGEYDMDRILDHIQDTVVHITEDERAFWNNKVRCYLDGDTIVFTIH